MPDNESDDKLQRIRTLVRVYQVHLHEAHPYDLEPPLFDTDDDCFVMTCRACDFAWAIEGTENADERYVLVEQS